MKKKRSLFQNRSFVLFFAGIFLAAEAADLCFSAAGKAFDYGLVLALCAAELFCGFVIAAANRRSSSGLTAVSGALLLTLRSGVVAHPAAGVCSFLIAGGTAAYLTENRRKNYFLPFASAFAGMLALLQLFPAFASEAAALSGIFLTGVLVLSATRLGHGRWLFLLLLPLQGFLFAADEKEDPQLEKLTALHCTAASALPSALLPQTEGGKVSILQVTALPQYAHLIPWRHIPFAEEPFLLDLTLTEPTGKRLKKMETVFDLVSLELLPRWHPRALEQLFKRLYAMTDPGGGVLVFPGELLPFVPPALQAVPVPGGENRRWAVGRSSLDLSVEKLESRLQKYLAAAGETDLMPPGVFTGLYKKELPPVEKTKFFPQTFPREHGLFFWCSLGLLWVFFRLILGRKGGSSAFFSAVDNTCSAALVVLTGFTLTAFHRMESPVPEALYLWCIVPPLACFGKKGLAEKILLLCSLVLPWLFLSSGGGAYHYAAVFGAALICSVSSGVTGGKLFHEQGGAAGTLTAGAICGTALAGVLFSFFFIPGNIVPVLGIAAVMRLGCLLRK